MIDQKRWMRDIDAKIAKLEGLANRERIHGKVGPRRQPRLAKTVVDPADSPTYPVAPSGGSTPANVFPFVFCDGVFLEEAGNQSITLNQLTTAPVGVVRNIAGTYIPVNSEIWVFEDGDFYFTFHGVGTSTTTVELPVIGQLSATLNQNDTANVPLLAGGTGAEVVPGGTPPTKPMHNLVGRRLWSGSRVMAAKYSVSGGDANLYRIYWSDSAMMVRGQIVSDINPGGSGLMNTIAVMDGRVGPGSSITVHNILANYTVTGGVRAFAEWAEARGRWEIYAADCAP